MSCPARHYSVVLLVLLSTLLPRLVYTVSMECAASVRDCQSTMNEIIQTIDGLEGVCHSNNTRTSQPPSEDLKIVCMNPDTIAQNPTWDFYPTDPVKTQKTNLGDLPGFIADTNLLTIQDVNDEHEGVYVCKRDIDGSPRLQLAACVVVYNRATLLSCNSNICSDKVDSVVGEDIVLNNTIQFTDGGFCDVRQEIDIVRFRTFENRDRELCNINGCSSDRYQISSDSSIIRIFDAVSEDNGTYLLTTDLKCPGDALLTHTFNVNVKTISPSSTTQGITSMTRSDTKPEPTTAPSTPKTNATPIAVSIAVAVVVIIVLLIVVVGVLLRKCKKKDSGLLYEVPQNGNGNGIKTPSMEGFGGDMLAIYATAAGDRSSAIYNDLQLKDKPTDQISPDII